MNAQSHEIAVEALQVADVGESPARPASHPLLRTRSIRRVAAGGRAAAAWLPAYAVASHHLAAAHALAVSFLFAAAWYVAIRHAVGNARVTIWILGPAVASAVGSGAGLVVAIAFDAALPGPHLSILALLQMALGVLVLSAAWESLVLGSAASRQSVIVVGAGHGGSELVEELRFAERRRFDVLGVVDDERESDRVAGVPLHGRIEDLGEIVEAQRPDVVVLANDRRRDEAFEQLLDQAHVGFSVVGLPEFYEYAFGRLPVRNLSAQWFMSILHLYQRPYTRLSKRTFDVVAAVAGLLLAAPVLAVVALLVRRTRGPAIFRQTRLGAAGRTFTIYKFRTMRLDAEAAGAAWASECDPRVTGLGRLLRRTRLDELPQLWNVLRGDMSIVGPRPERPEFMDELQKEVPFWSRRHLVKPGITGWAQVCRGYTADAQGTGDKLSYDLWYLRHRSLVVDLAICVRTLPTIVSGSGAR